MEQLYNGYALDIPADCFPLSTDSMVLADFVRLPRQATVLDLGSGCGTLGLLLCAKDPGCSVTGIEISTSAHRAAEENINRNRLADRMKSICTDLRSIPIGSYHVCVSNPPYYTGGPASAEHAAARRDDFCSIRELMQAASRSLRWGGDFFLVHKPEKLANLCALGAQYSLEAKQLRLVRHKDGGGISLILLQLRKGGKPGLRINEVSLFSKENNPTDFFRSVYHIK